jgi:hypothetical protein
VSSANAVGDPTPLTFVHFFPPSTLRHPAAPTAASVDRGPAHSHTSSAHFDPSGADGTHFEAGAGCVLLVVVGVGLMVVVLVDFGFVVVVVVVKVVVAVVVVVVVLVVGGLRSGGIVTRGKIRSGGMYGRYVTDGR